MNRKNSEGNLILTNTQKYLAAQVARSNFKPDLFGTLTFSSDPFNGNVNLFDKGLTEQQYDQVDKHISMLLSRLNKQYVSNRWYKKSKTLLIQSIFSIETHNLRYHVHFVAQTPVGYEQHDFRCDIQDYWHSLPYCYKSQVDIQPVESIRKSVTYISKDFEKDSGLGYSKYTNFS